MNKQKKHKRNPLPLGILAQLASLAEPGRPTSHCLSPPCSGGGIVGSTDAFHDTDHHRGVHLPSPRGYKAAPTPLPCTPEP